LVRLPPAVQPALAGADEGLGAFHRAHGALGAAALWRLGHGTGMHALLLGSVHGQTQHAAQLLTQTGTAQVQADGVAGAFFGRGATGMRG
jgi:hypothetical protein